ncbi:hypothetical protein ACQRIT_002887 [Beauveria bassiana]
MRPSSEDESGKNFKAIMRGHEALKAEVSDIRTAYNASLRALAQQQIDRDTERSSLSRFFGPYQNAEDRMRRH